MQLEVPASIR